MERTQKISEYPLHHEDSSEIVHISPRDVKKSVSQIVDDAVDDAIRPLLKRISMLEFENKFIYDTLAELRLSDMERKRMTWEASSKGGVD